MIILGLVGRVAPRNIIILLVAESSNHDIENYKSKTLDVFRVSTEI